jgi:hypothetical protein
MTKYYRWPPPMFPAGISGGSFATGMVEGEPRIFRHWHLASLRIITPKSRFGGIDRRRLSRPKGFVPNDTSDAT